MSFTDQKPFIVTKNDLNLHWGGRKNHFFCGFCGKSFIEGSIARWVFTNDVPDAGGNPFVCVDCDAPREKLIKKRIALRNKYLKLKRLFG